MNTVPVLTHQEEMDIMIKALSFDFWKIKGQSQIWNITKM